MRSGSGQGPEARSLDVLITNRTLATRTGTELYVRDLALGLLRRGHRPIVCTTRPGPIADELRSRTVLVADDLEKVTVTPDIIHGHHHPDTMTALLRFPGVPAVFFCHDNLAWHDLAPCFPRIRRFVAVDDTCRDRLVCEQGIPDAQTRVLLNAVDMERFRPRAEPLPPRPRRALVFSNLASEATYLSTAREACGRHGIALDVAGSASGASTTEPEKLLAGYDLVFAKARCALEALAVGVAVILCDAAGAGPLVTLGEVEALRRLNLGRRTLQHAVTASHLADQIARYDADDATAVSRHIRATADLGGLLDSLLALYVEVIAEQRDAPPIDPASESHAAAAYLQWLMLQIEPDRDGSPYQYIHALHTQLNEAYSRLHHEHQSLHAENGRLSAELDYLRNTSTWRLRSSLLAAPLLGGALRGTLRVLTPLRRRGEK